MKEIETNDIFTHPDNRLFELGTVESKNTVIEKWLSATYDFRYNTIKQKPEFKRMDEIDFRAIDKYKLLSLKRQLDSHGINTSKENLFDILNSSYSIAVNPIKEYFNDLNQWTGTDHILELAETVKTKNENFYEYLKKWLVGVVSNVFIEEKCTNHTMLVLTGKQGAFKTTWLENLCPKSLKYYLFTGKLNLESKDTLMLLAENLFINIDDQLKQLHKKDENELKNLITVNSVKYRRPYDPVITEYPHLASFMGSINGNEFLSDPTGSRRFLPFEVEKIDIEAAQKLNMDLVWAQALALFKKRFVYWFNDAEIEILAKHNKNFEVISQEEELFNHYYRKEEMPGMINTKLFLPPAIILSKLEFRSHLRLSQKKLGEALTKLKIDKVQKTVNGVVKWGYFLYEKDANEIDRETNEVEEMHEF